MNELKEFEEIIDHIYGVYLDSTTGFGKLNEWMVSSQSDSLARLKETNPDIANIEYLDSVPMIYGKGNPNESDSIILHQCTQKKYKQRNTKEGDNYKFIGNMAIVSIYQYWEDHYRSKIAALLNIKKNDLKAPIMGDLRILRRSIVHHAGITLKEITSCETVNWFKENEVIFISPDKMQEIVFQIKLLIQQLTEEIA